MTLSEALLIAQAGGVDFYPMRRSAWVRGLETWWSRWRCHWMYTSADYTAPSSLPPGNSVFTPDAMLADDWEVMTP